MKVKLYGFIKKLQKYWYEKEKKTSVDMRGRSATFSHSHLISLLFSHPSKRSKTMTTATKTLRETQHDYSDHITPS